MFQHLESLHAELVLDARENQTRDAGIAAGLYVESCKNCFKRIEQFVQDLSRTRDVQAEKSVGGPGERSNSRPTSLGDAGNNAGAGPFSA